MSEFINCSFYNNSVISFEKLIYVRIPASARAFFLSNSVGILARVANGEKYTTKVMKANLKYTNCTFDFESRFLDVY